MVHLDGVVLMHFLVEQRHGVPDEQVSHVLGHLMIDVGALEFFVDRLVVHQGRVVKPASAIVAIRLFRFTHGDAFKRRPRAVMIFGWGGRNFVILIFLSRTKYQKRFRN